MARPGITYVDVAKAAEAIANQGNNPTVDRVLAKLGSGSKSTIGPFLKKWKADTAQVIDTSKLPNPIMEAVVNLNEQLQQSADLKIEQITSECQAQIESCEQELLAANAKIAHLEKTIQQHIETEQCLSTDNNKLKSRLEAITTKNIKLEAALSTVQTQLNDKQAMIAAQKSELKQINDHFEHFQQQSAEDRQHEREQLQIIAHQLETRITGLNQQLIEKTNNNQVLLEKHEQLEADKNKSVHEMNRINQQNHQLKLEVQTQKDNITTLNQVHFDVKKQIIDLSSKLEKINEAKEKAEVNYRLLHQRYEQIEQKLMGERDNNTHLSDENKMLAHEKSVLQGQFKQLCSTHQYE